MSKSKFKKDLKMIDKEWDGEKHHSHKKRKLKQEAQFKGYAKDHTIYDEEPAFEDQM